MFGKPIYICVQKDIVYPINWILKDFERQVVPRHFDSVSEVHKALEKEECEVLLLDSIITDRSTLDLAREVKDSKASVKILLVVSIGTTKEEVMDIIKSRYVNGILLRPFTATQVSEYIYRLTGIPKPSCLTYHM